MVNEENKQATSNYKRWLAGQNYLGQKGLLTLIPQCVDFEEGRQWPQTTEATQHIPRPMLNFIRKIIDHKQSNILGTPVHLNFRADNDEESTEKFTKFANYQMKEMQMDFYDNVACYDGLVKGTYVYYFYWDADAIGQKSKVEGALRAEIIDPLNIVVANPVEIDIQKQKWVIIRTREDVDAVKALCDSKERAEQITSDSFDPKYADEIEQEMEDQVYVYTRFFRQDNEVYYEKSTKGIDIHGPIPMNPTLSEELIKNKEKDKETKEEEYKLDPQVSTNMDDNKELEPFSSDEMEEDQMKFSLYPIEIGSLQPRNRCIYGISEVEGVIELQKGVNFDLSMLLKQAQELGWGKYIVKNGALKGQKINNLPGQVITDFTPVGQVGIKQMEGQQIPAGMINLINQLIDGARVVTNSTDVVTGDSISKDLSGTAIMQIQAQAQKPIEQMQRRFWRSKERIGKILEQYYKLFYENAPYSYEISEEEYSKREDAMQRLVREEGYNGKLPKISTSATGTFNGNEFRNTPFNIVVEAGKGTQYSEIMQMDFVNNLILNGTLDRLNPDSLEIAIKMYPDKVIANKTELLRLIKQKQNSEIARLQAQVQQAGQLLQQAQVQMQQKDMQVKALGQYNKELEKEFTNKINEANSKITSMEDFMKSYNTGSTEGNNSNN